MENKEKYILDFLQGKLSREDAEYFQEQLAKNAELRAEVEDYQSFLDMYRDSYVDPEKEEWIEEKKRQVEAWEEELEEGLEENVRLPKETATLEENSDTEDSEKRQRGYSLTTVFRVFTAAAAVAAGIFIIWTIFRGGNVNYEALAQKQYGDSLKIVKTSSPDSTAYLPALEAFNTGDFEQAKQLAEQVTTGSKYYNAKVILAHACFKQKDNDVQEKYRCAIDNFRLALQNTDSLNMAVRIDGQPFPVDNQQLNWYLALSHLALGEVPEARAVLEQLAIDDENVWQEKAEDLLTIL